ncbi:MAG: DUF4349 domain-containing protein [Saprospiraceae bacterium]
MDAAAPETFVSSTAAVENNKDSTRKFIRTADLKFKVKDAIRSTYDIENITVRQGGFVKYTNLASTINYTTSTQIKVDSISESTFYTVNNKMKLRVPNFKLDTVLKEIARNIEFLDYRIIKADDVALNLMTNDLTQERNISNEERLRKAIDNKSGRLNDITNAEDNLESKQEKRDAAHIANLRLKDQINFSTINLVLYQRQDVKNEIIGSRKIIEEYKPGFGSKFLTTLMGGWMLLETLILFIAQFWALLLLASVLILLYKRFRHRVFKK